MIITCKCRVNAEEGMEPHQIEITACSLCRSAPDLLRLLKLIHENYRERFAPTLQDEIRKAIAKAETK